MRNHVTRDRTNVKCKSCGNPYNPQVGCGCWVDARKKASTTFQEALKKGGCKSCGSTARAPAASTIECPCCGELVALPFRKARITCETCKQDDTDSRASISAIAAGFCPICYGLPHRRDAEHCTWCGGAYAQLAIEEADAWAGYGAFPVEEIDTVGDTWREHMMVTCPVCKRSRELHLSRAEVSAASKRPCRSCSLVEENMRRKGKKNGTSI